MLLNNLPQGVVNPLPVEYKGSEHWFAIYVRSPKNRLPRIDHRTRRLHIAMIGSGKAQARLRDRSPYLQDQATPIAHHARGIPKPMHATLLCAQRLT